MQTNWNRLSRRRKETIGCIRSRKINGKTICFNKQIEEEG